MTKKNKELKLNSVSIVIPLYNEESRLDHCFHIIKKFLRGKKKSSLEIIFVDDGSVDQSKNKILKFINNSKKKFSETKIKLISYKKNMGKGYAIKKGIFVSKSKWILSCDLDMSVIPDQYEVWKKQKLIKNVNCAYIASRQHKDSNIKSKFIRRKFGGFLNLILSILFDLKISDTQCGFKLFHSTYIKKIFSKVKCYNYAFDVETLLLLKKNKIRIIELPVKWIHRPGSKVRLLIDSMRFFSDLIILKKRL